MALSSHEHSGETLCTVNPTPSTALVISGSKEKSACLNFVVCSGTLRANQDTIVLCPRGSEPSCTCSSPRELWQNRVLGSILSLPDQKFWDVDTRIRAFLLLTLLLVVLTSLVGSPALKHLPAELQQQSLMDHRDELCSKTGDIVVSELPRC